MCDDLVGSKEIQELFAVNRQRVWQLSNRPDFPPPLAVLALGAVWRERDIRKWANERGREVYDIER